jgi:hypothetical protein
MKKSGPDWVAWSATNTELGWRFGLLSCKASLIVTSIHFLMMISQIVSPVWTPTKHLEWSQFHCQHARWCLSETGISRPAFVPSTHPRSFVCEERTYCHVSQWLKTGFGLVIGLIDHLQVLTTNNYNTVTDFHTTKHSTPISSVCLH